MVKKTHLLLNSKMIKSFLGRSNSNFGSNQLTSMVDMPCRIIMGKFQLLKQGFGFIVHTRIFKIATFQERKYKCYWWKIKTWKSSLLLQTLWNANLVIIKSKYQTRGEVKRTQTSGFVLHYFDLKFCPLFCINEPISWN